MSYVKEGFDMQSRCATQVTLNTFKINGLWLLTSTVLCKPIRMIQRRCLMIMAVCVFGLVSCQQNRVETRIDASKSIQKHSPEPADSEMIDNTDSSSNEAKNSMEPSAEIDTSESDEIDKKLAVYYPNDQDWDRSYELPEGFTWQTNLDDPVLGSFQAERGGTYKMVDSYPATLALYGPGSIIDPRHEYTKLVRDKLNMTLVSYHEDTYDIIPLVASHWGVHESGFTNRVYFRINSHARWSDGQPITSDDVVFIKTLADSEYVRDDSLMDIFYQIKDIRKLSPNVVVVEFNELGINDALLRNCSELSPVPSYFYTLDQNYRNTYLSQVQPTSGPYVLNAEDSELDGLESKKSVYVFQRVQNWWGDQLRYFKHNYNYDTLELKVGSSEDDQRSRVYDHLQRENISTFNFTPYPMTSVHWQKVMDSIQPYHLSRGYWRKHIHYRDPPRGGGLGIYLNTLNPHLSDPLVRKAVAHIFDVDGYLNQPGYHLFARTESISNGYGDYDHPDIVPKPFDPDKAKTLMEQAGYTLNEDRIWSINGQPLEIKLAHGYGFSDRSFPFAGLGRFLANQALIYGFDIQWLSFNQSQRLLNSSAVSSIQGVVVHQDMPISPYPIHFSDLLSSRGTMNYSSIDDAIMDHLIADYYGGGLSDKSRELLSQQIIARADELDIFIPFFYVKKNGIYAQSYIKLPNDPGTKTGIKDPLRYGWIDDTMYDHISAKRQWRATISADIAPRIIVSGPDHH